MSVYTMRYVEEKGGTRERLKERFSSEGLDSFTEIQVLELMLFYCVPRQDTNPLAHRLLEHFGTLAQVLDASPAELERVPGVGKNVSTYLKLSTAVMRRYLVSRAQENVILDSIEKCGDYLVPRFFGKRNETVLLLCLDAKCKVLCCKEVGEGTVNTAAVPIRRVVEIAMSANATSVVMAHNHTSGVALPTKEDVETTRLAAQALRSMEIQLIDHIVVAEDDYTSMVLSGLYRLG